jgi:hypothetical protein
MNQTDEIKRVSVAPAGLASAITEVINERLTANPAPPVTSPQITVQSGPPKGYLGKRGLASVFHVSIRTIENWMVNGWLPYRLSRLKGCFPMRNQLTRRLD